MMTLFEYIQITMGKKGIKSCYYKILDISYKFSSQKHTQKQIHVLQKLMNRSQINVIVYFFFFLIVRQVSIHDLTCIKNLILNTEMK